MTTAALSATSATLSALPLRRDEGPEIPVLGAALMLVLVILALVVYARAAARRGLALPKWLAITAQSEAHDITLGATRRINPRVSVQEVRWDGQRC